MIICNINGDFHFVGWSRQLWKTLFTPNLIVLINLRAEPSFQDGGSATAAPSSGDSIYLRTAVSYYRISLFVWSSDGCQTAAGSSVEDCGAASQQLMKFLNKHYLWKSETFITYSAQENKRRHVTHFFLLCGFSMCALCHVIAVSKEQKVCF